MPGEITFLGAFESLRKDREGEVKITFTVPLSDEQIARQVPILTKLRIVILNEPDSGCSSSEEIQISAGDNQ
jgi:hypothetical protein